MIALLDYGSGNLRSVHKALLKVGANVRVAQRPAEIGDARAMVLPGVGAFDDCINALRRQELLAAIHEFIRSGRPFLGICVGYQALFDGSDEFNSRAAGLGVFSGRVVRFAERPGLKIPQIGWNQLELVRPDCPLYRGIADGSYVYFVHSFHPQPEDALTRRAGPLTVPDPISRRKMDDALGNYYGVDGSIYVEGVPPENVVVCDLSQWGTFHGPPAGRVGIDPVLGRILFASAPTTPPIVTFHHGFSADLGGGEYERQNSFQLPAQPFDQVAAPALLQTALAAPTRGAVIQVTDNGRYEEALSLTVKAGEKIELRAANEQRPTLVLPADFVISGGDENAEVTLNGFLIAGGGLRVTAKLARLRLRHCTLVPGLALNGDGTPQHGDAPSLVVGPDVDTVEIDHCILGGIRAETETNVELGNSILDATSPTGIAFAASANAAPTNQPAASGTLTVENCTVIGRVRARYLELASNSIFIAEPVPQDPWPSPIFIERRQTGCVRFCYLRYGSLTPRRYRCQPELEMATRIGAAEAAGKKKFGNAFTLTDAERESIRQAVLPRLKPSFTSRHYGQPAYGQLRLRAPEQIRQGADDESEMGAFHDLFAPQREMNLRVRLDEYLRFSLSAGIFYVT